MLKNPLQNLKIKYSFLIVFGLIMGLNLASDFASLANVKKLGTLVKDTYDKALMAGTFSQSSKFHFANMDKRLLEALLAKDPKVFDESVEIGDDELGVFLSDLDVVIERKVTEREKTLSQELKKNIELIRKDRSEILDEYRKGGKGTSELSQKWIDNENKAAIYELLEGLTDESADAGFLFRKASGETTVATEKITKELLLGTSIFSVVLALLLIWVIAAPVAALTDTCRKSKKDYSIRSAVSGRSEIGELSRTFNSLMDEIQAKDIEAMRLLREVIAAKEGSENLLNNMKQSVFAIGADLIITSPVSKYSSEIFGKEIVGEKLIDVVFSGIDKKTEMFSTLNTALSVVFGEDEIQWMCMADEVPDRVTINHGGADKILRLNYAPLWDSEGLLVKIMMVIEDVTELERLERESSEAKKASQRQTQILQEMTEHESNTLEEFFERSGSMLEKCQKIALNSEKDPEGLAILFRELHTLKGNSRVYKFSEIASTVHKVETFLAELRGKISTGESVCGDDITRMTEGLNSVREVIREYQKLAIRVFKISSDLESNESPLFHHLIGSMDISIGKNAKGVENLNDLRILMDRIRKIIREESLSNLDGSFDRLMGAVLRGPESGKMLPALKEFKISSGKYFSSGHLSSPIEIGTRFWVPLFLDSIELTRLISGGGGQSDLGKSVELARKIFIYCESYRFGYPGQLFKSIEVALSGHSGNPQEPLREVWRYLSLYSRIEIDQRTNYDERQVAQKAILDFDYNKPDSVASFRKLNLTSAFVSSLKALQRGGADPMEILSKLGEFMGVVGSAGVLDQFIGPEPSRSNIIELIDLIESSENMSKLKNQVDQNLPDSFVAQIASEFLSTPLYDTNHTHVSGYSRLFDVLRILRGHAGVQSEIGSTYKVVQVDESVFNDLLEYKNPNISINPVDIRKQISGLLAIPLGTAFRKFKEMVHDISSSLGKKARFFVRGGDILMNRDCVYILDDALLHILRNSVDHGIETPETRLANGKEPFGTIVLEARRESGKLLILISDDGKGVDSDRVRSKALEKGIRTHDELEKMTNEEIDALIFQPEFSTQDSVSQISGRGVGMDVVMQSVKKIKGEIAMENNRGKGLRLTLTFDE